jgi:hypothetical protein
MVALGLAGGRQRRAGCLVDDSGAVPVPGQLGRLGSSLGKNACVTGMQVSTAAR